MNRGVLWACGLCVLAVVWSTCAHEPPKPPPPATAVVTTGAAGAGVPRQVVVEAQRPDLTFWKNRKDLITAPAPPVPAALPLPRVSRWKLPNGLDAVAVPRGDLPIVSFSLAIKAGAYDEQKDRTQGVADFTAGMLRHGAGKRTAEQIADTIDSAGGSLEAGSDGESTLVTCSVLAARADTCLSLLADVLLRPTFPEKEMAEVRDQMLASLAQRADDPHLLAAEHFDNLLFGEGHPDGWVLTPEHVNAITRDKLLAFWKAFYRPNNAILAIAGDIDPAVMKTRVERAFGGWASAAVPQRPAFEIPAVHGKRVILVDKPELSQATLMFGHAGIRHADPDWYAVTLVNYVLGGSDFSSRLMQEVRSKRGLTYGIGSSFGASLYQGAFRVSASTRNETAWDALSVATAELSKMKASGPTEDELAKAKGYYAGSTPFTLESAAGLAHALVGADLHGLGVDYVRTLALRLAAVDRAAADAAAKKWLDPEDLSIVIVGRADVVGPELKKAKLSFERVDARAPISAAARRAAAATPAPGR